ncbi:hypothetical protein TcasGA2_TC031776 [Tribolium castaneum]|uniref:CCHC-type domain-containing protein n=1 Tax=Tribolium castaneum TaxID=7070 RepID=A0A139W964_TRICA|nr:hypothetical protein TcasGA2_TC031776 [Tribolium castaneum]
MGSTEENLIEMELELLGDGSSGSGNGRGGSGRGGNGEGGSGGTSSGGTSSGGTSSGGTSIGGTSRGGTSKGGTGKGGTGRGGTSKGGTDRGEKSEKERTRRIHFCLQFYQFKIFKLSNKLLVVVDENTLRRSSATGADEETEVAVVEETWAQTGTVAAAAAVDQEVAGSPDIQELSRDKEASGTLGSSGNGVVSETSGLQNSLPLGRVEAPGTSRNMGYCVMPDLTKSLRVFNGKGGASDALQWLQDIKTMAGRQFWGDAILLEVARQHLVDSALLWYRYHQDTLTTWAAFEMRFRENYTDRRTLAERFREMSERKQRTSESAEDYFYAKMAMCRDLKLSFAETKEMLLTGLKSREVARSLLTVRQDDEWQLLHMSRDKFYVDPVHHFGYYNFLPKVLAELEDDDDLFMLPPSVDPPTDEEELDENDIFSQNKIMRIHSPRDDYDSSDEEPLSQKRIRQRKSARKRNLPSELKWKKKTPCYNNWNNDVPEVHNRWTDRAQYSDCSDSTRNISTAGIFVDRRDLAAFDFTRVGVVTEHSYWTRSHWSKSGNSLRTLGNGSSTWNPRKRKQHLKMTRRISKPRKRKSKLSMNESKPTSIETKNRFSELTMDVENEISDIDNNDTDYENSDEDTDSESVNDEMKTLEKGKENAKKEKRKMTTQQWITEQEEKMAHTPITIKKREEWRTVERIMKEKRINYTKATTTRFGIRVQPQTIEDYRNLRSWLEKENIQMTTHTLREERPLKIVAKGVPTEWTIEEIEEDLKEQGYPTRKVVRMISRKGTELPMVLIDIERKYKSLYNIPKIMGINIEMESLRRRNIIQCHRCQEYGHVQRNCTADYKCLKCGEGHSTHLCDKERTTPAKCANCGGPHPANSIKCPKKPMKKLPEKITAWRTQQIHTKSFDEIQKEQREERRSDRKSEEKENKNNKQENKKKIVTELSELLLEIAELKPTDEQTNKITSRIGHILKLL